MAERAADADPSSSGSRRRISIRTGLRTRLVGSFIVLLALATATTLVVEQFILIRALDQRIDRELVQETRELRRLARGLDPSTGRPFGRRIRRLFELYFERNIAARHEAIITFVGGEPFLRSRQVVPYRLDTDPELVARWTGIQEPDRDRVTTPAGDVEFLAVPVRDSGDTIGVFVVAIFRDLERADINPALVGSVLIGLLVLLIGSLLAWRLANQILKPVGRVQATAVAISESDLTRRIEVEGEDEIARLAETFNQMLDRLEEAFQDQKRFLDDVSHELRTPITVVRGHLEFLEDDPEERRKTIELVTDELDRMTRLVDELMLLVRSDRPDFLKFDLVDVETFTREIHEKATALAVRDWKVEETGSGRIAIDRHRVTQALMQLADNAAAHTEEGDTIAFGSAVSNGMARFWVRDEGPGISPDQQDKIFERFRQGDGASAGGAGLGLSIVRAIAEAHRGQVDVHSRPGRGATFTLTVPIDEPQVEDAGT